MLIYVIPFILLLVFAIVLKKREASKEVKPTTQKATAAKNKAKKQSSSKKAPQQTQIVETAVAKKATTPLATDLRNKIEGQIRDRNFFSAEAQINQALNKDNTQHELYLLLLDIHLLQKDEFAISQLLNHLRSLELEEILTQAEAKKLDYDQLHQNSRDTIEFKPTEIVAAAPQPVEVKNTADFDALMSSSNTIPAPTQATAVETTENIQPLHFDTSAFTASPATQSEPKIDVQPLDFDTSSFSTKPTESTPLAEEVKPLDFGALSLDNTPVVAEVPVEEIKPLDFSFNLDSASTATPEVERTLPVTDDRPEFTFDFSNNASPIETIKETQTFSFDTAAPNEPIVENPAPDVTSAHFNLDPVAVASATDLNDPLVQSFPQLVQVNEISLNLELAEQYIQLGAFEAARQILTEQEVDYSAEQRQQAEQLLSRIAS